MTLGAPSMMKESRGGLTLITAVLLLPPYTALNVTAVLDTTGVVLIATLT